MQKGLKQNVKRFGHMLLIKTTNFLTSLRNGQYDKRKLIAISVIAAILFLLYQYWLIMLVHGTFLPPFVNWQTKLFDAVIPPVDPNFVPDFRIVLSLSTLPHHLEYLDETITSLVNQKIEPNQIYLNLPDVSFRTKQQYYIPQYLIDNNVTKYKKKLIVLRSERDYGPLTKLFPVLLKENTSNTLIITVDDDKTYPSNSIQTIAWYSHLRPDVAWGDCGWSFQQVPHPVKVIPIYVPYIMRGQGGRQVEVLQAICGNGYRRSHFRKLNVLSKPTNECFTTDDTWISAYLHFETKVPRVLIKENIVPETPKWKDSDAEIHEFKLNYFNRKNAQEYKCIHSIERVYNQKWLQ